MKIAEARALAIGTTIHEVYRHNGILYAKDRSATLGGVQSGKPEIKVVTEGFPYWRWESPICWFTADHPDYLRALRNTAERKARYRAQADIEAANTAGFRSLLDRYGSIVSDFNSVTHTAYVRVPLDKLDAVAAILQAP